MFGSVTVPLWVAVGVGVLALLWIVDKLILPAVRGIADRRHRRVLGQVDRRLKVHIQPFRLTKHRVVVDRLLSDDEVRAAIASWAESSGKKVEEVEKEAAVYAREIAPAFNAWLYFKTGYALARGTVRSLFRVRLGYADLEGLARVDPDATVVFVVNHRSNMDYLVVSYLIAERAALSYAVGEWARRWPLESLLRSMGAYFVRRYSRNDLYRSVLRRYVQMATEGGTTQAVFPEGRLSRSGGLEAPKLGLLDYMLRDFDPEASRDVVFVPVAVNYDRVLEDRTLLLDAEQVGTRRGAWRTFRSTSGFALKNVGLAMQGRWYRFGYGCVNFGTPLSARDYMRRRGFVPAGAERADRFVEIQALADELMRRIGDVVPVVPVATLASVLVECPERAWTRLELEVAVQQRIQELQTGGARVYIPRNDRRYSFDVGLRMLMLRRVVLEERGELRAKLDELDLLRFYASSIAHLVSRRREAAVGEPAATAGLAPPSTLR